MTQLKEKRTALFVYLYMACIGGILIALVGYGLLNQQTRSSAFERSGITVTATYIGGRALRGASCREASPANCRYQYFGQVRFKVDGQTITAEAPVSAEFHGTIEPGDTIQIRYLSEEPKTVQIDPLHETRAFGFMWMIALLLAGCLGYWLIRKRLLKRAVARPKPKVVPPELEQLLAALEREDAFDDTDRTCNLPPDMHRQMGVTIHVIDTFDDPE